MNKILLCKCSCSWLYIYILFHPLLKQIENMIQENILNQILGLFLIYETVRE